MKKDVRFVFGLALGLSITPIHLATAEAHPPTGQMSLSASITIQSRNEISGTVFGAARRPVADVYLELLDDVNSTVSRAKTDGSGRFRFGGLVDGRYKIRVLPYGTDYLEQTQEITLASVSAVAGSGSDRQQIDIYLKLNERANAGPFAAAPGVVFAQAVPEPAKRLYEEGINYLREKKEKEGLENLKRAIEVFPDYYLALDRLGAEYVMRGTTNRSYYEAGLVLLAKAVEVNPRGYSSVFGLGWTQYQLGQTDEAIENLRRAVALYNKAADTHLWLGKALKRAGKLDQAEAAFKRANELTNGKAAEVHWQMAGLYNDQKRYKEAADELELFLKAQPKAADAEKIRGLIKQLREKADTK
ncbi:MAG: tetratricopeptide repeat protein [Pyrinomonadaceae bacterium]